MEAILIKKPQTFSFSGSPIPCVWAVTPYTSADQLADVRLQLRVLIEKEFGSEAYTEEYIRELLPDADGKISIEIQSILDPFLKWFVPPVNAVRPVIAEGQSIRYKLQWVLIKNNLQAADTEVTNVLFAIKGGMSYTSFAPAHYFNNLINEQFFLGVDHNLIKTGKEENRWLYYLEQSEYDWYGTTSVNFVLRQFIKDDTGNFWSTADSPGLWQKRGQIICFPVGYNQLDKDYILPSSRKAVAYTIELVEEFTTGRVAYADFELDYRNFYNTHQLYYRNSDGGLNTIRFTGQVEYEADYQKQQAQQIEMPDYFRNGSPMAITKILKPEETQKSKGATGFVSKNEIENLRDLFLSQECYEFKNNKLIPVIINNSNVKFYTNKDGLYSLVVEWEDAFPSRWNSKAELTAVSGSCPSLESFNAIQISTNDLQISYALQAPYDMAEVEITYNTTTDRFYVYGNCNVFKRNMDPTPTANVTVRMRTVCNATSVPIQTGSWSTQVITYNANVPPTAVDDNIFCPPGVQSATVLQGNLLTNDYDPDGDPIECVPVTNQPTTAGGTISISTAGVVTYNPPSSSFSGLDSYTYGIRNVGGSIATATAKVFIQVSGLANFIFVKLTIRNQRVVTLGPPGSSWEGTQTMAEVWVAYTSDVQGFVLQDVTQRNIDISFRELKRTFQPSFSEVNTDTTVDAVGSQQKLYDGVIALNLQGPNVAAPQVWVKEFSLLPNASYQII